MSLIMILIVDKFFQYFLKVVFKIMTFQKVKKVKNFLIVWIRLTIFECFLFSLLNIDHKKLQSNTNTVDNRQKIDQADFRLILKSLKFLFEVTDVVFEQLK